VGEDEHERQCTLAITISPAAPAAVEREHPSTAAAIRRCCVWMDVHESACTRAAATRTAQTDADAGTTAATDAIESLASTQSSCSGTDDECCSVSPAAARTSTFDCASTNLRCTRSITTPGLQRAFRAGADIVNEYVDGESTSTVTSSGSGCEFLFECAGRMVECEWASGTDHTGQAERHIIVVIRCPITICVHRIRSLTSIAQLHRIRSRCCCLVLRERDDASGARQ
jgi:hypothetical protein